LTRKTSPTPSATIIYGLHPVVETLKAGRRQIHEIYLARELARESDLAVELDQAGVVVSRVSVPQILAIAGTPHHQGIAARAGPFPYMEMNDLLFAWQIQASPLLVLDGIQDPANLGNILRSAECLGGKGVILAKDRAVAITSAVEKASAGASAHIPVARVVNLTRAIEQLKAAGYWIYAADPLAPKPCYSVDLTGKIVFVLGSEGKGIRRLVREKCDGAISIPLAGKICSLNVSQTAAILLSESLRQRTLRNALDADEKPSG
jgi:23S rRNA (guanosine2251-2'-O)-methyltransferase